MVHCSFAPKLWLSLTLSFLCRQELRFVAWTHTHAGQSVWFHSNHSVSQRNERQSVWQAPFVRKSYSLWKLFSMSLRAFHGRSYARCLDSNLNILHLFALSQTICVCALLIVTTYSTRTTRQYGNSRYRNAYVKHTCSTNREVFRIKYFSNFCTACIKQRRHHRETLQTIDVDEYY